jgi:hypothetical protein
LDNVPVRRDRDVDLLAVFRGSAMPGIVAAFAEVKRVLVAGFDQLIADFFDRGLVDMRAGIAFGMGGDYRAKSGLRLHGGEGADTCESGDKDLSCFHVTPRLEARVNDKTNVANSSKGQQENLERIGAIT